MFRKLVSNLPYSPALISDISFYANRLKQEEVTRRSSFIIAALAVAIQSFAIMSPPEAANASSEQDLIRGGVSSIDDFLIRYDRNEEDIKDIYTSVGITREEIQSTKPGTVRATSKIYIMNRYGQIGASGKEASMSYAKSTGGTGVRYFSPMTAMADDYARFRAFIGESTSIGWFAIILSNGSLATKGLPPTINPSEENDSAASRSISIRNISQNIEGNVFSAKENDKIAYTIKQTNVNKNSVRAPFSLRLTDALEYAVLLDSGGGSFDNKTKTLSWPSIQLQPNESQTRTFILQVLPEIPATGKGVSNPSSYDCNMNIVFGNSLKTPVNCPPLKGIEGFISTLPLINNGANIAFSVIIIFVIAFFYLRARQLKNETRIIRHNFNTGSF